MFVLSFLNVKMLRVLRKFTTYVYRKPIFSRNYNQFEILLPSNNKTYMIDTSLCRCFRICSDSTNTHHEKVNEFIREQQLS